MTNVRTILVPVDFTPGSVAAVRHARELSDIFRSHVHLLHVAVTPDVPRFAIELFGEGLLPLLEQHRLQALDQLAGLIVSQGFDPFRTTGLVRAGSAEEIIPAYAEEVHADLIVMGVHGDHFIPQLTVGEVLSQVLGQVRCPVLTVPEQAPMTVALDIETPRLERVAC